MEKMYLGVYYKVSCRDPAFTLQTGDSPVASTQMINRICVNAFFR
jgi:hypothetical protein